MLWLHAVLRYEGGGTVMSNYDPQVIIDLIRKVGIRANSDHLESLGFSLKPDTNLTASVWEHMDGTRLVYVLGYLNNIQTPDIEIGLYLGTGLCGSIKFIRFGTYEEFADHSYPLTRDEEWNLNKK